MSAPRPLRWLLLLVPVVLIAAAFFITRMMRPAAAAGLRPEVTYEIWVGEAEVAPTAANAAPWDADGSAPDLRAVIVWQDQRVYETVTAADGFIAVWEPIGVRFSQVIHGEADSASVRRVGRVRVTAGGSIEVGVFDDDPARSDPAGVLRLPWTALRPGINEWRGDGALRRLRVMIAEPGMVGASMSVHRISGAEVLAAAPAAMDGTAGGLTREAARQADQLKHRAGEKAGEAVDAVKQWLKPDDK